MTTVFIRIALRYLAALLIARGVLSPDMGDIITSDPEIAMALQLGGGALVGIVAEGWYYLARRFGWSR